MSDVQLTIGAQTRAAQVIQRRLPEFEEILQALGTAIDGSASSFRGTGAAEFGKALQAWATKAVDLPQVFAGFGEKLVQVDQTMAKSEEGSAKGYSALQQRLGGIR